MSPQLARLACVPFQAFLSHLSASLLIFPYSHSEDNSWGSRTVNFNLCSASKTLWGSNERSVQVQLASAPALSLSCWEAERGWLLCDPPLIQTDRASRLPAAQSTAVWPEGWRPSQKGLLNQHFPAAAGRLGGTFCRCPCSCFPKLTLSSRQCLVFLTLVIVAYLASFSSQTVVCEALMIRGLCDGFHELQDNFFFLARISPVIV